MRFALGIDIGGTKIRAGLVDAGGAVARSGTVPTPAEAGPVAVLDAAATAARGVLGDIAVAGCGVGTAGTLDGEGIVRHATSALLGWCGTDVAGELRRRLALDVHAVNDVHAAALGEARFGAARGAAVALIAAVGTGIGGAVVRDGAVDAGAHGAAGAIGHMTAPRSAGRPCPCGRPDHLEAYASGPAIAGAYAERVGGEPMSLSLIAARARAGDQVAAAVFADAGDLLGKALGALANVVDPEVVVLTGGVLGAADLLLAHVRSSFGAEVLLGSSAVSVRPATLGADAAVIGAASLAFTRELK